MDEPNDEDPAPPDVEYLLPPHGDDLVPSQEDDTPAVTGDWGLYTPLPLDYLQAKAEAMTDIGLPGHLYGIDPPDEPMPMDTVRAVLFYEDFPLEVRDTAWRYLITNTITQRGDWYAYAIGAVAGKLQAQAYYLVPGGKDGAYDDKRHVHQHLAVGFLAELHNVRPDAVRIGNRIIWRAAYRAKRAWWANREAPWPPIPGAPPPPPEPTPTGDPNPPPDDELPVILRNLVVATADVKPSRSDQRPKVTAADAALLTRSRLAGRTIAEAAAELGISPAAARSAMPRAKRAVFTLLASRYRQRQHPRWVLGEPGEGTLRPKPEDG